MAIGATASAKWTSLGLGGINAKVAFSPHIAANALLKEVADDIGDNTTSSLFYSLAFLYQMRGPIRTAIVGYGLSGRVFHAPFIAANPRFSIAVIATGDPSRRAQAARDHPDAEIVGSPEELLARVHSILDGTDPKR